MIKLEELVDQVLAIDSSKNRSDILLDLKYTKSVEETINRIFDGDFLKGVERKPSPSTTNTTSNDTCIILDSDEEDEENKGSELDLPELPNEVVSLPSSRKEINFFDDNDNDELTFAPSITKESDIGGIDFSDDDNNDFTTNKHLLLSSRIKGLGTDDMLEFLDDFSSTSNKKKDAFQDDDDVLRAGSNSKKKYTYEDDEDVIPSPPKKTIEKSITLNSLEDSPTIPNSKKYDEIRYNSPLDEEFPNTPPDDDNNAFLIDSLDSEPHTKESANRENAAKQSLSNTSESNNSVSLVDSDSDDSLPSMNDFFDQLLSQKRERDVIEIEDIQDRKGKRRAYEYNVTPPHVRSQSSTLETTSINNIDTLTSKERKKLEAEERKRNQVEERKRVAEEKKIKRVQLLEEKKRAKEQKQLEKERSTLLEKENRIKNNRNEILKEMIVDMHPDFLKTKAGELLKLVLDKKEAQTQLMESANNKYHIAWRRICTSEWNPDTMTFVPFATSKIIKEPYALVYVDIYEFVGHVKADTVDQYIDQIQRSAGNNCQLMLLVEGLEVYYKKKQLLQRRQFDNQIRSSIEGSSTTTTTTSNRRKNNQAELENGPDREQVEECINYLQFMRDIMFVLTKDNEDTASWIESLTTDLALGRYKTKNINNSYKVGKCGTDPSDNFHKMLQEIQLCTPAIASSVMSEYPTLQSLHKAYERKDTANGEALLANLEVERSALQARDRKINRVMSKKIYTIFNSNDPDQIIY